VKATPTPSLGSKDRAKDARGKGTLRPKQKAAGLPEGRRKAIVTIAAIRRLADKIAGSAPYPTTVTLFGSYARGTAGPSSDIDLLVIEDGLQDWPTESVRLRRLIRQSPPRLGKPVNLVVMSRADYRKWRLHFGTVQYEAESKGIRLVD
jgi:uncharacterized protein